MKNAPTLEFLSQVRICLAYSQRYQDILLQLPSRALELSAAAFEDSKAAEYAGPVRAYIDLCAEEEFMHRLGVVPDEMWALWKEGIANMFRLPHVWNVWTAMKALGGYEGLVALLKEVMGSGGGLPSDSLNDE